MISAIAVLNRRSVTLCVTLLDRRVERALELLVVVRRILAKNPGATTTVTCRLQDGDQTVDVSGSGVGAVDALYNGLVERYGREYQSLKTIQIVGFQVSADMSSKHAKAGGDAVGKVTLEVVNSENRYFTFTDESRSVTTSSARAVIQCVQYFVNAERAFLMLYHARRDALERGREDLVARYTAELAEIVESTSTPKSSPTSARSLASTSCQ